MLLADMAEVRVVSSETDPCHSFYIANYHNDHVDFDTNVNVDSNALVNGDADPNDAFNDSLDGSQTNDDDDDESNFWSSFDEMKSPMIALTNASATEVSFIDEMLLPEDIDDSVDMNINENINNNVNDNNNNSNINSNINSNHDINNDNDTDNENNDKLGGEPDGELEPGEVHGDLESDMAFDEDLDGYSTHSMNDSSPELPDHRDDPALAGAHDDDDNDDGYGNTRMNKVPDHRDDPALNPAYHIINENMDLWYGNGERHTEQETRIGTLGAMAFGATDAERAGMRSIRGGRVAAAPYWTTLQPAMHVHADWRAMAPPWTMHNASMTHEMYAGGVIQRQMDTASPRSVQEFGGSPRTAHHSPVFLNSSQRCDILPRITQRIEQVRRSHGMRCFLQYFQQATYTIQTASHSDEIGNAHSLVTIDRLLQRRCIMSLLLHPSVIIDGVVHSKTDTDLSVLIVRLWNAPRNFDLPSLSSRTSCSRISIIRNLEPLSIIGRVHGSEMPSHRPSVASFRIGDTVQASVISADVHTDRVWLSLRDVETIEIEPDDVASATDSYSSSLPYGFPGPGSGVRYKKRTSSILLKAIRKSPLFRSPCGLSLLMHAYRIDQNLSCFQQNNEQKSSAIPHFQNLRKLQNTNWARDLTVKGIGHAKARQYATAMKFYASALELDSQYAPAYTSRGALYMCQGRMQLAIQNFLRTLEYDPSNSFAANYLKVAEKQMSSQLVAGIRDDAIVRLPKRQCIEFIDGALSKQVSDSNVPSDAELDTLIQHAQNDYTDIVSEDGEIVSEDANHDCLVDVFDGASTENSVN